MREAKRPNGESRRSEASRMVRVREASEFNGESDASERVAW